jgi:hypothetical protein
MEPDAVTTTHVCDFPQRIDGSCIDGPGAGYNCEGVIALRQVLGKAVIQIVDPHAQPFVNRDSVNIVTAYTH